MFAHRIETTISTEGTLHLSTLPFHKGEEVEVIILRREPEKRLDEDDLERFFATYQADFTHFKFNRDEANER